MSDKKPYETAAFLKAMDDIKKTFGPGGSHEDKVVKAKAQAARAADPKFQEWLKARGRTYPKNVSEALRLKGTYTNGEQSTKVYKDNEWGEYRVKLFKNGKHQTKADSHHDDADDAHSTAKHMIGLKEASNIQRVLNVLENKKDWRNVYDIMDKKLDEALIDENRYHVLHEPYSLEAGKVGQRSGNDKVFSKHSSLAAAGRKLAHIIHSGKTKESAGTYLVKDTHTGKTYSRKDVSKLISTLKEEEINEEQELLNEAGFSRAHFQAGVNHILSAPAELRNDLLKAHSDFYRSVHPGFKPDRFATAVSKGKMYNEKSGLPSLTRQHFQKAADHVKSIEHPEVKREMHNYFQSLGSRSNSRFDGLRFKAASGINESRGNLSHEANELVLYGDNDSTLYNQSTLPILNNLKKKMAKGKYDHGLAAKLWGYHADRAAQKYHKEFGSKDQPWHKLFPTSARREAAQHWADYHRDESLKEELGTDAILNNIKNKESKKNDQLDSKKEDRIDGSKPMSAMKPLKPKPLNEMEAATRYQVFISKARRPPEARTFIGTRQNAKDTARTFRLAGIKVHGIRAIREGNDE